VASSSSRVLRLAWTVLAILLSRLRSILRLFFSVQNSDQRRIQGTQSSLLRVLPRPETLVTFGYRPKLHQDEGISSF
jgi:hypothetical protein